MSIVGLETQLRLEEEVLAEREERIARYTRFFSSPHAKAIAAMSKPDLQVVPHTKTSKGAVHGR